MKFTYLINQELPIVTDHIELCRCTNEKEQKPDTLTIETL